VHNCDAGDIKHYRQLFWRALTPEPDDRTGARVARSSLRRRVMITFIVNSHEADVEIVLL
jgi:hypothetical protein